MKDSEHESQYNRDWLERFWVGCALLAILLGVIFGIIDILNIYHG